MMLRFKTTSNLAKKRRQNLSNEDIQYLIGRLERVIELIDTDEKHMAVAKLLADISALKGMI
jgi:hypothetical protein